MVYEANVADLIEQGFLSPLVSKATAQQLDVSGVRKRGGEYVEKELQIAVDKDWITRAAVQEIAEFGADRRAWLAFCAGVKHAENVRDAVQAAGFTCETVTGETPKGERDRLIQAFRQGQIRCLTSVGVLGTGFNVPHVDLIALLRPTNSAGLYIQQVGRALRKSPGKENALILDFAGLVKKHGPIDTVTVGSAAKAKDPDAEARVLAKECPNCATLCALNSRSCSTCSFIWPLREEPPKHEATADASSAILSKGAPAWVAVDAVRFYTHRKDGSPDSVRVEYQCGFTTHKEWLGFQHAGMMRQKAERFWVPPQPPHDRLRRAREIKPIPRTTEEATDCGGTAGREDLNAAVDRRQGARGHHGRGLAGRRTASFLRLHVALGGAFSRAWPKAASSTSARSAGRRGGMLTALTSDAASPRHQKTCGHRSDCDKEGEAAKLRDGDDCPRGRVKTWLISAARRAL